MSPLKPPVHAQQMTLGYCIRTQHTLLVVDVGAEQIAYHDPALAYGPVSALLAEFLLAWGEMDERAAFLSRE